MHNNNDFIVYLCIIYIFSKKYYRIFARLIGIRCHDVTAHQESRTHCRTLLIATWERKLSHCLPERAYLSRAFVHTHTRTLSGYGKLVCVVLFEFHNETKIPMNSVPHWTYLTYTLSTESRHIRRLVYSIFFEYYKQAVESHSGAYSSHSSASVKWKFVKNLKNNS